MNHRIGKLRQRFFDIQPEICPERARFFTRSMIESEGQPIVLRRARAFEDVLKQMSLFVGEDELIVGNQASKPRSAPIYPEYSYEWIIKEFDGDPYFFDQRPADTFSYTEKTKSEILSIIEYWKGKTIYENLRKHLPQEANLAWDMGIIDDTWVSAAGLGNIIPDFVWVLERGLEGVIAKAEAEINKLDLAQPDAIQKKWFLEACIIANRAVIRFSERLADYCEQLAEKENDGNRRQELLAITSNCRNVPANGARTFWEALQSTWIILLTLHLEANGHAISLGRFDQYLYPYYQRDIEEGRIDRDEALELVEAFMIKTNELNKLRSWPDTSMFTGYHMAINLAVGGITAEDTDATNEISHLCVEACADLKLFTPSVSIKVHEKTDPEFLDKALEAVRRHKGGQPAFYNDEAFMEILRNMGVAEEDLFDWAPVGCIEAHIPGKWDYAAKGPWLNVLKVLEMTLNGGKDPKSAAHPFSTNGDLESFQNIDEVFESFKKQLHFYMRQQVITEHISDAFHKINDLNAFRSSLVHDCIERGKTLIEGGSIYSADGGPTTGIISAADSLSALEHLIFEEKRVPREQLIHALETDFEDMTTDPTGEEIRHMLLNRAPKFGNDDDRADKWAVKIADFIGSSYQKEFKNSRYGKGPIPACYALSQSPVTGSVAFGRAVGATPDGRKSGSPLNNGISPSNGAERNGPTAVVNSVGKMPYLWFQKGAILNIRFTENAFSRFEGRERILNLMKVLFDKKGVQVQFNVVDNETLLDAMKFPEKYPDLMVRVSGYSAYFVPLDTDVKRDIIERVQFDI